MQDFMKDRYGVDELSTGIGAVGIVLALIGTVFSIRAVSLIALVVLVAALGRAFSKNMAARRRENEAYKAAMAKLPVVGRYFDSVTSANGSARPRSSARDAFARGRAAAKGGAGMGDIKRQARTAKRMWRERKTKAFLKCPTCGTILSVPKGKGRIIVTCPKCHTRVETKS